MTLEELKSDVMKDLKDSALSKFKERFKDFITYHQKALNDLPLERRFCEEVMKQKDWDGSKKGKVGAVSKLIGTWQSKIYNTEQKKIDAEILKIQIKQKNIDAEILKIQIVRKKIEANKGNFGIRDLVKKENELNKNKETLENEKLEMQKKKLEMLKLESKNMESYIENVISEIQKDGGDKVAENIKNSQDILIFAIEEKLLPSATIMKLAEKLKLVKLLNPQTAPNSSDIYKFSAEANKKIQEFQKKFPNLDKSDPRVLQGLNFKKINKVVAYHYEKVSDLILQISTAEKLSVNIIEKALSSNIKKKAIISALEMRALLDPEIFLCLKGRVDLMKKLYDFGVDVVGITANKLDDKEKELGNKEKALEFVKIGFDGFLVSSLFEKLVAVKQDAKPQEDEDAKKRVDKILSHALYILNTLFDDGARQNTVNIESILNGRLPAAYPGIKDKYLEIIKEYVIPYLESRVFDKNYESSPQEVLNLVQGYLATKNTKKLENFFQNHKDKFYSLEKDIEKLINPKKGNQNDHFDDFINKCILPITDLAIKTQNVEIINIVKDGFEQFAQDKFSQDVNPQDVNSQEQNVKFREFTKKLEDEIFKKKIMPRLVLKPKDFSQLAVEPKTMTRQS